MAFSGINKLSGNMKQAVLTLSNEFAGVRSEPSKHIGQRAVSLPDASWKSPVQALAEKVLGKWFGR